MAASLSLLRYIPSCVWIRVCIRYLSLGRGVMGVLVSVCSVYTRRRFASLIPGGSGFDFHSDFGLYVYNL
jgi:hypothetical protein